jgi:hypothetical protein
MVLGCRDLPYWVGNLKQTMMKTIYPPKKMMITIRKAGSKKDGSGCNRRRK